MNKFHAKPTTIDGIRFASKREAKRYGELKLLQRANDITDLEVHPTYKLTIDGVVIAKYTADFAYTDLAKGGKYVVEDVKSPATKTRDYKLKAKLMLALKGIEISEVMS